MTRDGERVEDQCRVKANDAHVADSAEDTVTTKFEAKIGGDSGT